jgi:hypothetical protein
MKTTLIDADPQRTLSDANDRDKANSVGAGVDGFTTHFSAALMTPLPSPRDQALASRPSVVAIALSENTPGKRFKVALDAARELHAKSKEIGRGIREADFQLVRAHYARLHGAASTNPRLHAAASKGLVDGNPDALIGIEPEAAQAQRLEAEINARQAAMSNAAFAKIEHAVVLRDEIDGALAKLIDTLKARDAASSARYGIETDFSVETRLAVSVRILFARQTFGLRKLENAKPGAGPFSLPVKTMIGDFLPEVAAWE